MMGKPAWVGFVSAIVLALVCAGIYAFTERSDVAQATPVTTVGVDADPTDNTATYVDTIDSCISVDSSPDPFYIDLFVEEITNLNLWDVTFRFDESVLEVNSLAADGFFLGSSTHDPIFTCTVGECLLGTFDTTGAGHDGEGVLGRLEITAIGAGISKANLDLRAEGLPVSMIVLRDGEGTPIGSIDEDEYFDGSGLNAEIAVDQPCPGECLPENDTDSDGFNDEIECYLPTDPLDDCTDDPGVHDAWPLDVNIDKIITAVADVLPYSGKMQWQVSEHPEVQRLDLNGDGIITATGDVLPFSGMMQVTCT